MQSGQIFIGIELQHAWRLFTWAAVDPGLKLLALHQGRLPDLLTYLGGVDSALVAVNAPPHPNCGRLQREKNLPELFNALPGDPTHDLRQVEHELLSKGFPMSRTPAALKDCPAWMRRGFRLCAELKAAGFIPLLENPSERNTLETSAEAIYKGLLTGQAFPAETIQGRIQRQLVLWENRLPVRDPMTFFEEVTRFKLLHSILPDQDIQPLAQLNAIAAAYVAYLTTAHPDRVQWYGEPEEGQICLPLPQKPRAD